MDHVNSSTSDNEEQSLTNKDERNFYGDAAKYWKVSCIDDVQDDCPSVLNPLQLDV